jgi:hypothetical protein
VILAQQVATPGIVTVWDMKALCSDMDSSTQVCMMKKLMITIK